MKKTYNPSEVEDKWYQYWLDQDFFSSNPDSGKEPFTIVIPPPNVTGVLHMGHMLNNTIQDVLTRRARMQGKEACWVPGTDHASIATEAKVVAMLKEQGIDKRDISREEFLKHAYEWKDKYGGIILEQLKKLGASCDWKRTNFTMNPEYTKSVIKVFVDLYNKGLVYRGPRMVNWDPEGQTTLGDEEVIYEDVTSKLYYVKYKIEGAEDEWVTIATTRPETILADTAICVNPEDERFKHLVGKKAIVPMVNRPIPIIADAYVDVEFGTGCLKVTPAHDINDYELGLKHNLEIIDIINDDGSINEKAQFYIGQDRFEARESIAKDLKENGQLVKVEEIQNSVGTSERTKAVVEPKFSTQWFVKMKELSKPALENVMNDNIKFHPPKFKNTYKYWMENVRDWCISRQLWWGQRIPAYYLPNGELVVAETAEEALVLAKKKDPNITAADLKQDEDVVDTWFSSWLWPISVFDGLTNPGNEQIKYYYPTSDLVTAPEILFFWVARMIIAGYEYLGEKPFSNVYLTGIVRDKQRRKMSKSLGNSPDPIELIKEYGADGVRTGMLFSSPAGNDLLYDDKLCLQGRNFSNKIWNAFRLIKGWDVDESISQPEASKVAVSWFEARFNEAFADIESNNEKYRLSDSLMGLYKLIWDDFCSSYLESIKPEFEKPIDKETLNQTISLFEKLMKVLHPFMPFITEEIWHEIKERDEKDCIIISDYPQGGSYDQEILDMAQEAFEVVSNVRNIRNKNGIAKSKALELYIKTNHKAGFEQFGSVIKKLANLSEIKFTDEKVSGALGFVYKADEFFIPAGDAINVEEKKAELLKELEYAKGSLQIVEKKLSNERFVNNAPEKVVALEKKKKADAENKIKTLQEAIESL